MCLAVPGLVIEIFDQDGLKMGRIDYAGSVQRACLEYVPEVREGEYVVVHAGFAITVLDQDEAQKSFEVWREMIESAEEQGPDSRVSALEARDQE